MVEAGGVEPPANPCNCGVIAGCGPKKGPATPVLPPDLAEVVNTWEVLTPPLRAAVLALVRAALAPVIDPSKAGGTGVALETNGTRHKLRFHCGRDR